MLYRREERRTDEGVVFDYVGMVDAGTVYERAMVSQGPDGVKTTVKSIEFYTYDNLSYGDYISDLTSIYRVENIDDYGNGLTRIIAEEIEKER